MAPLKDRSIGNDADEKVPLLAETNRHPTSFDDVFHYVGEFGRYQIGLYVMLGFVAMSNGYQAVVAVFIGGEQDHWCFVPELQNFSRDLQKYIAMPYESRSTDQVFFSKCSYFDLDYANYSKDDFMMWNRTAQVSSTTITKQCADWVFDQSQYTSTFQSQFLLVCNEAYLSPLVQTLYMMGFMLGCVVFGAVSDSIGRHKTLLLTLLSATGLGVAAAYAPYYPLFVLLRFMVGAATAGGFNTGFVLGMELIGPSYRMKTGIFYSGWSAVGFCILPGVAYFVRDHQLLQVVLALPCILAALVYSFAVPESPRWLMGKGNYDKAQAVIENIARRNGRVLPDGFHLKQFEAISTRKATHPERKYGMKDLFRTSNVRKITTLIGLIWLVSSFCFYGFSLNVGAVGDVYLNAAVSGMVEFPMYIMCVIILDRVGRTKPLRAFLCLIIIFSVCSIPFIGNKDLDYLVTVFASLGKFATSGSSATMFLYAAEVFPTVIRNAGVGFSSMCARIGAVLSPQVVLLEGLWHPAAYVCYAGLALMAAVCAFFIPETLNRKLPDTLEDADGLKA